MRSLFAPWRYSYLVQERSAADECIFCTALSKGDGDDSLLLYTATHNFVILNLFPYNNGHLMVVPKEHVSSPSASSSETRAEMMDLAAACETVLRKEYHPDGINLGMNLGRAAGAGIESHYHLHLVPRWAGDTNFMAVTAETRIIPEDLMQTRSRLRSALRSLLGPERSGPHSA